MNTRREQAASIPVLLYAATEIAVASKISTIHHTHAHPESLCVPALRRRRTGNARARVNALWYSVTITTNVANASTTQPMEGWGFDGHGDEHFISPACALGAPSSNQRLFTRRESRSATFSPPTTCARESTTPTQNTSRAKLVPGDVSTQVHTVTTASRNSGTRKTDSTCTKMSTILLAENHAKTLLQDPGR